MVTFSLLPRGAHWGVLPESHKGGHVGSQVIACLLVLRVPSSGGGVATVMVAPLSGTGRDRQGAPFWVKAAGSRPETC